MNFQKTFVLFIGFFIFFSGCAAIPERVPVQRQMPVHFSEFETEFSDILGNLLKNYWHESGNWKGDMQGDATAFAAILLYELGLDSGDEAMTAMANATVQYEVDLVQKFLRWPKINMEMVIGFPALASGYQYEADRECAELFSAGVKANYYLISRWPGILVPYVHDKATVYGTGSYMCFQAYDLLGTDNFKQKGLKLIEKADEQCWDEDAGLYAYTKIIDWPQLTMMTALLAAYRTTEDIFFLERVQRILSVMDETYFDHTSGSYFGHPDTQTKGLSGNNTMIWVLLDLYTVTGEIKYLNRARDVLSWIFSEDLYDGGENIIYHHWSMEEGRAGYLCTGCNFHTLCNVYRYNKLRDF